jgi:hypothetical protein
MLLLGWCPFTKFKRKTGGSPVYQIGLTELSIDLPKNSLLIQVATLNDVAVLLGAYMTSR